MFASTPRPGKYNNQQADPPRPKGGRKEKNMKKRVYLATVESNSVTERVILAADLETNDDGNRWTIVALLPGGIELDTTVNAITNCTLDDVVQCIAKAWDSDVCNLQWLPKEEI